MPYPAGLQFSGTLENWRCLSDPMRQGIEGACGQYASPVRGVDAGRRCLGLVMAADDATCSPEPRKGAEPATFVRLGAWVAVPPPEAQTRIILMSLGVRAGAPRVTTEPSSTGDASASPPHGSEAQVFDADEFVESTPLRPEILKRASTRREFRAFENSTYIHVG